MAKASGYFDAPYLAGDPIPAPEAVERASESAWALWNDVASGRQPIAQQQGAAAPARPADPRWAATVPGTVAPVAPGGRVPAAPVLTPAEVMVLARRNGRVCPRPAQWLALYKLLRLRPADTTGLPLPPLAPDAWRQTSALEKRLLLRDQLEWARRQRCLPAAARFLVALAEEDWLHID